MGAAVRHPWRTVALVSVITILFVGILLVKGIRLENDFANFVPEDDPVVAASTAAEDAYGAQELFLVALVAPETIFQRDTLAKFAALEKAFEQLPGVDEVVGPASVNVISGTETSIIVGKAMPSVPETAEEIEAYRARVMSDRNVLGNLIAEDGTAGAILITPTHGVDEPTLVAEIRAICADYEGPEEIFIGGDPVLFATVSETMTRDISHLIPYVLVVLAVVLFLMFRTLRGVALPLLVVFLATLWAIGTMALFDQPMTPFAVIMPVMLLAIGAADGIHILNAYNELAASGIRDRRQLVLRTMKKMAAPVVLTSLTTAGGFLALLSAFMWPQRSMGAITAVGVLYAMILSLTLVPALLAQLRVPKERRRKGVAFTDSTVSRVLGWWARKVASRRWSVLAVSVLLLVAFAVVIPRVSVETQLTEFLGPGNPVVQAGEVLDEHFGGSHQMGIDIRTGRPNGLKDPALLKEIVALQDYLLSQPQVGQVSSFAKVVMQLNETVHSSDPAYYAVPDDPRLVSQLMLLHGGDLGNLALRDYSRGEVVARIGDLSSKETEALVLDVQSYLDEHFPDSVETSIVGAVSVYASLIPKLTQSAISSLFISLGAAVFFMILLMRSVGAGLLGALPLVFALVFAYGAMFYAGLALDVATVLLGSIAVGIGIDYSIHFIGRLREERKRQESPEMAYEVTMRTTGKGIAFNAVALTLSFAVLLLSEFRGNASFGWLVMLTMMVSAAGALTVVPIFFMTWTESGRVSGAVQSIRRAFAAACPRCLRR